MIHLTDGNFNDEVSKSKLPVIVDFWAAWCAPCKRISPIFEELSKEYEGKVKFTKLNVEEGQNIASKFGIMSVPTMIIFKDGKVIEQLVGLVSKEELNKKIAKIL